MKLYVTPTSPYARLAMIVRLELGLADRVELVWTRTRNPADPMLAINPSGRIPFLLLDDGTGYEDTDVIVPFLDDLEPPHRFDPPDDDLHWVFRGQQAISRSMLDGISVWAREIVRPEDEQSPGIIEHERKRAMRLAEHFEAVIDAPPLTGDLNMIQLFLFCALNAERRMPDLDWRTGRPGLVNWFDRVHGLPSVTGSSPPPGV
jgi:glutathione S-transferase